MILICIRDSSRAVKYDGLYSLQHSCHIVQPLDRDTHLEIVWLRAFSSSVLTYKKSYALFDEIASRFILRFDRRAQDAKFCRAVCEFYCCSSSLNYYILYAIELDLWYLRL